MRSCVKRGYATLSFVFSVFGRYDEPLRGLDMQMR